MFMQSAAMALAFGSFFQYGKRKISSMSNQEFNVLTPEDLTANLMSSVNNMIPTVEQSFHQMEQMNVLILDAMAKYFNQAVGKIEQWIQTGGRNLQQNVQTGITDPIAGAIEDFFDSGGQLLPSAGAEDYIPTDGQTSTNQPTKYTAVETFAQRWIRADGSQANFSTMPQAAGLYLLKQISKGNLNRYKQWRTSILKKTDSFNVKPLTSSQQQQRTQKVITKTTIQGSVVQQIATMYNDIRVQFLRIKQFKKNIKLKKAVLVMMKKYNQFVQINRKPALTIDTAKSIKASRIVPKS